MIAVTGATGFLGSHLVRALAKNNLEFICLVRSKSPRMTRLKDFSGSLREVDFTKSESVEKALAGCDTLVHSMGLINGEEDILRRVNIDYTRALLQAAKGKIKKMIFISSVAAIQRHGFYGKTKFEAEEVVRASGIPYLILRPAFIYGNGDENNTGLMIRTLKKFPLVPLLGGGNFKLQPIYVGDVVSVILEGLQKPAPNREYNIAGPGQISLKEILEILAFYLNVQRCFVPVPLKPVQFVVRLLLPLLKYTSIPAKQILELDKHEAFDISKTQADFNFNPMPFPEGAKKIFDSCAA